MCDWDHRNPSQSEKSADARVLTQDGEMLWKRRLPRQAMRPTVFPSLLANWMETKMGSRRQIHVASWTSSWWREAIGSGPCRKKKLRLLPRRKHADTKSDFRVINDMPPKHLPTAQLDLIYRTRTNSSSTFRLANTGIARVGKISLFVHWDLFN